jgi:hypothetical protein
VLKCRILDQGDLEIMPIKPQGKVWVGVNDIRHNKNYHTAIIKRVIRGAKSYQVHCKKRLAVFPSPAGMSLTKLSLARK